MKTQPYITLLFFWFGVHCAQSQEIQIRAHHGYLAAHREHMQHLVRERTSGGSISFERTVSGSREWHHNYGLPQVGVTGIFINWGNRDQLGYGFGLFPHIHFPVVKNQRWSAGFKMGAGPGIVTKSWNPADNHKNTVFSSPAVITIQAAFPVTIHLSDALKAQAGISITHMSNGATKLPNSGGNFLAGELGLSYSFWSEPEPVKSDEARVKFDKPNLSVPIHLSGFFKEGLYELTGQKPVGILSVEFAKRLSRKSTVQAGMDLMYNGTLETVYTEYGASQTPHFQRLQYGVTAGYHLTFDSWEIYLKQGFYLHSRFYPDGRLYHRFGVRTFITPEWFFAAGLKSHFFVADFFEFGFGRALWKK